MPEMISAVINTLNEEKGIGRAIKSVLWADEVLVCDMYSDDKTVEIAKKLGARVIYHKRTNYVEPARNFAISKAEGEWILILDADEEVPESLKIRLNQIATRMKQINYVRIPRENVIFNKRMKASMWWPDLNVRFFRKGEVRWSNKIHRPPEFIGEGLDLEVDEKLAIVHYNYQSISQFVERMNRYTTIEAKELIDQNYQFHWGNLIQKPLSEFLSRFFANRGFEDGLHGLALSLLQAFSQLVVYLKVWEMGGFKSSQIDIKELKEASRKSGSEIDYWFNHSNLSRNSFKKFVQKLKTKLIQ